MQNDVSRGLNIPAGVQFDNANNDLIARISECLAHPLAASFKDNLQRLAGMAAGIGGRARLYLDFSPLSLGWSVLRADGSCWMAGGLIFNSPAEGLGNGGAPSFSVSLSNQAGWELRL